MANETTTGTDAAHGFDVLLLDPTLCTAPYDACLSQGLVQSGVRPFWAVRPLRAGEDAALEDAAVLPFFYAGIDGNAKLNPKLRLFLKGLDHMRGLAKSLWWVARHRPTVVHVQWAMLPPLDALFCAAVRPFCPLVVTVHDSTPYNGDKFGSLRSVGLGFILRRADALIVHTQGARSNLLRAGIPDKKIAVIPHGPLPLKVPVPERPRENGARLAVTLFGQLKPYKGLDWLIEAVGRMDTQARQALRIIVAGKSFMDMNALYARIKALGLESLFEFRLSRLSDAEMAGLFAETDVFVFPYSQVDASGVYFLVKGLKKWLIASRVGIFAEDIDDGATGRLVSPGDTAALAAALSEAMLRRETPVASQDGSGWNLIGKATRGLYEKLAANRKSG